jgi:hypothetical protein
MIAQKTNKQRWAAWSLAALLLLAMLVAGNAAATSPGEAALNAPPAAASRWRIEARNGPARCRLCRPQPIPPP